MITKKAEEKARVLVLWEKHGLTATLDAFSYKRSTLFSWKKQWEKGGKKLEALNDKSKSPKTKRKRLWPKEILKEIERLREEHPNLGEKKLYPELLDFSKSQKLSCPKPVTIGRIIYDLGGLRSFPKKVSHFGKIKKANREKVLRKPKNIHAKHPGHLIALDTIERFVNGCRRYVITFEDIYTRFSFAWATTSHASQAAKEFFELARKAFPYSYNFLYVLTDNGSEFKKHFTEELKRLHLTHFHTYPKTPKMNAHVERFNRTLQEEFIDYHSSLLVNVNDFNNYLMGYLIWYNTKRVHHAFKNKLSPFQFMILLQKSNKLEMPQESRIGWGHTFICVIPWFLYNENYPY